MTKLAARLAQLGRLARATGPSLGALARVAAATAAPPVPRAGIAVLEGPPVALVGDPTIFRVRLANPTAAPCALTVSVEGRLDDDPGSRFEATWTTTLGPATAEDRWITTTWRGDAVLHFDAPAARFPPATRDRVGRWTVTARTLDGAGLVAAGYVAR